MIAETKIPVLLVEDSPTDVLLVCAALDEGSQFRVTHTERLSKALELLRTNEFQAVLLDLGLPDSQGLETLLKLRRSNSVVAVVIMTGNDDDELAIASLQHGAQDYLVKSDFRADGLRRAIRHAIERNDARRALRESEERYRRIVETTIEGIWTLDAEDRTTFVNQRMAEMMGYTEQEMIGQSLWALLSAQDHENVAVHLKRHRQGISEHIEQMLHRRDGKAIWATISAGPFFDQDGQYAGAIALMTDVSERKRLEEQVRQSQKLEAFGTLAGGVAHDFNNLLTVILGYSDFLLSRFAAGDPAHEFVSEIKKAGERATSLTRQMLIFSRQQVVEPVLLNLNAVVTDTEKMLRRLIGEDVHLTTQLATDLCPVKADPGHVEQVIMNLAVNARDAMPTGGKLTIETANVELDASYAKDRHDVRAGTYALLAVSDTGHGMTAEVQARIFEPFFTTKGVGKGTGLGLATVYGILKQAGGHVAVYSEPGHGTTFKIYFPRATGAGLARKSDPLVSKMPSGSETVLLTEDAIEVRTIGRTTLKSLGYTVLEAVDGEQALKVAEEHTGPIHLLVTDVIMPNMGGRQLAERMTAIRPETKVLYISGYTDDAIIKHGVLLASMAFLQKPFTPGSLAKKVRAVLDGEAAAASGVGNQQTT